MKILISAFACDPNQGSEPGAGWAWAKHLARSGHEVCVMTRERNRVAIESHLALHPEPNMRFIFLHIGFIPHDMAVIGGYPNYVAWQFKAFLAAPRLMNIHELDCVHHLTFGNYRTPFFLSLLGAPSIFGPVAGGESIPVRLTRGMTLKNRFREWNRIVINSLFSLNPITRLVWRRSSLILVTTEQTLRMVPPRHRHKCKVLLAVTAPPTTREAPALKPQVNGRLRVLFVGRLLEWKGLHLAIQALAIARRTTPGITFSIIGNGPAKPKLLELIESQKVADGIEWVPRVPRDEVMGIYDKHDLLIFPSLRDGGGMVILEAFSRGLPVLCLSIAGTRILVDSTCGALVPTDNRSQVQIIQSMAEELIRISSLSESEMQALRDSAYDRAEEFTEPKVVGKAYAWFASRNQADEFETRKAQELNGNV